MIKAEPNINIKRLLQGSEKFQIELRYSFETVANFFKRCKGEYQTAGRHHSEEREKIQRIEKE